MIFIERRRHKPAIPPSFMVHLNSDQIKTYVRMQEFGWQMHFIRRPLFRRNTVVLINNAGTHVGLIKQNGVFTLNMKTVHLRD